MNFDQNGSCDQKMLLYTQILHSLYNFISILVIEAYEAGQRHFGENYVQELIEKSSDPVILEKCPDIKWHFIGTIQQNKIGKIVKTKNLDLVETIASLKYAEKFQNSCQANKVPKLGIMVQVNIINFFGLDSTVKRNIIFCKFFCIGCGY